MRKKKKLIWQIFPSYLLITLISLIAVTWYASEALRRFFLDQTALDLQARALLLEKQLLPHLEPIAPDRIDAICKEAGQLSATRFTVLLPEGKVIGDSSRSPTSIENLHHFTEIRQAATGMVGRSIRTGGAGWQRMMYIAIPIRFSNETSAIIQTSIEITPIDDAIQTIQIKIALGGFLIAILAAMVSLLISRRISRPIEKMKEGAERFSSGNLAHRLPSPDTVEFASLTDAMNQMAAQLDDRIKTAIRQRNELEAVLTSMVEGVVAVDDNERIINLNRAAVQMFECDPDQAAGRNIQEIARNIALQQFIANAFNSQKTIEEDIVFYRRGEMILHVQGTPLRDAKNEPIGILLVFNDVTKLRHLEDVRRDFVANVSHEIKTPLTAIKGFVETLHQGAVKNPAEHQRFLGIILKHVDRLNAIVEDLLSLSRIEQENERKEITFEVGRIQEVIHTAVQVCQTKANAKNIAIDLNGNSDVTAKIDVPLLEQALVNLIDNAIKYSDVDSRIKIETQQMNSTLSIRIKDQGQGIPRKHLPRLFERFYRVDKARSRNLGGTGLGLAIVKHIVQAHGGQVTVDSMLGKGSTFTVMLPRH